MARPARFERATAWFVARYSIQLSYGRARRVSLFESFTQNSEVWRARHDSNVRPPGS